MNMTPWAQLVQALTVDLKFRTGQYNVAHINHPIGKRHRKVKGWRRNPRTGKVCR